MNEIIENLRFGSNIRELRHRPRLIRSTDELNLIAFPRQSSGVSIEKTIWILCRDRTQLA